MVINILMSTYNGERFLAEQIDSIRRQTVTDWNLLIRDDGSSDATPDIIQRYVEMDSRIHFINAESNNNLGVIKSFFKLVKYSKADYYFFSDQDDVWLPDKLELTLAEANKFNNNLPLMVYTDLKVVNQNLEVINESMIRSQSNHANTQFIQELTENTVTGGTALINHALAERWTVTDNLLMHDWYLALLATAFGKLVYIDQATELYRQHGNNVLGARTVDKRFKIFRLGPEYIFTRYWKLIHDSQNQAKHLLGFEDLPSGIKKIIENFIDIDKQGLLTRLRRIVKYKYSKNQLKHILVFRFLLITNIYNGREK